MHYVVMCCIKKMGIYWLYLLWRFFVTFIFQHRTADCRKKERGGERGVRTDWATWMGGVEVGSERENKVDCCEFWKFFESVSIVCCIHFILCFVQTNLMPVKLYWTEFNLDTRSGVRAGRERKNTGHSCFIHTANIQSMSLYIIHGSF